MTGAASQAASTGRTVDVPMDSDFTEEEMEQLSDEEREALKEDDTNEGDAGENDESKEDDDSDRSDDDSSTDESNDDDAESKEEDNEVATELSVQDVKSDSFLPQLDETGIEDYDSKIDALASKYEDGDITLSEYTKETQAMASKQAQAEANVVTNNMMATQRWEADKDAFFASNPVFKEANDPDLYDQLDAKLRRMATAGSLDGMSNADALVAAANEVSKTRNSLTQTAPLKESRPRPKASTEKAPESLRDIPAADDADVSQGKFAKIDSLEGEALEDAVASLSEADRKQWEEMA